ncbi:DUF4019 domain-containing protein [Xanthomonas hyacinthi]|uniref:DUF4019 domain-containing protein n=1 Tax=Xanthomonas hyacinthi TaxID=56455 RepID=A0A2S7EZD9_9XANT|nr:DUF4019 domain-containing protein [Xanthomonas hyacinthi]PPU98422.1 hypothetical protein XhyaCFBP1156_06815 [Xanthomonas hyacinthi]QGY79053.1 DUF4019 domain-containing protein [Xanthomonas hyacinthi]
MPMSFRLLPALLCAVVFAALAQTAPTPPATTQPATPPAAPKPVAAKPAASKHADPAAPGPLSKQDAQMAQAGLRAAQLVDAGRSGELWDGASAVAKKAVAREAFVRQVDADRALLGALLGRGVASVARVQYAAGSQVPPGVYVNISFPSRFANAPQPVRELVSLRLDEDTTWRLVGYHVGPPN